jgi:hypothetical protein
MCGFLSEIEKLSTIEKSKCYPSQEALDLHAQELDLQKQLDCLGDNLTLFQSIKAGEIQKKLNEVRAKKDLYYSMVNDLTL